VIRLEMCAARLATGAVEGGTEWRQVIDFVDKKDVYNDMSLRYKGVENHYSVKR